MTKFLLFILILFMGLQNASAFNEAPQTVTLDGFLYKKGTTTPLVEASILLKIQILNPTATCLLYEEQQTVNTSSTKGYFSLQVGSLTGNIKRTVNDPGRTMAQIFQNTAAIVANDISTGSCSGGTYIPSSSDIRYFRITVTPGSTSLADTLTPDIVMDSVPQAIVAQSLQGLERANVLAVNTSGTVNLSQTNLESLFSGTAWTNLQSILNGNFLRTDSSGATLPSYASTPAGVSIGDMWYDSATNEIKYQTNAGTQTVGATGSVSGNSITSGTISGSTAWNTSGNITTIGTVTATTVTGANVQATNLRIFNGSNYVQLMAQAMSGNYTLALPPADGVSGQIMATNGAGVLSWVTPSGGVAGTISIGQGGTGVTSFAANRIIASNGTGSALQAFTCSLNQVISFDASGNAACQNVSSIFSGIQNGGNSTGAAISIGTNDSQPLNFKTNNSIALTISQNGSVGIGTASPTEPLHVVSTNPNLLLKRNSNASDTKIMMVPNGIVDTNNPTYQLSQAGSGYNHFALQVYDGATTSNAIYISRLSNVGIGGAPISKFDVVGTSQGSALSYSRASTDSGLGINPYVTAPGDGYKRFVDFIAWGDSQNGIASTMRFFTQNSSNVYSPKLVITGSGEVGIGTSTPAGNLHVLRSGASTGIFDSAGSGTYSNIDISKGGIAYGTLITYGSNNDFFVTAQRPGASLHLGASGTDALATLDNAGNFGIGSRFPTSAVDVSGAFTARGMSSPPSVSSSRTGRIYFDYATNKFRVSENGSAYQDLVGGGGGSGDLLNGGNSTGASVSIGTKDNQALILKTNDTAALTISSNGNAGIGTSNPSSKLEVTGDIKLSSGANRTISLANTTGTNGDSLTLASATVTGAGNYNGGSLTIASGSGVGTGNGGTLNIFSGANGASGGVPGQVIIMPSSATGSANGGTTFVSGGYGLGAVGGPLNLTGGLGLNGGGAVNLMGGQALAGNSNGGNIIINGGAPSGSGNYGSIWLASSGGNVGIGISNPSSALDISGSLTLRGLGVPAVSPVGQGRIYFDSTSGTFKISQNGNAYTDLTAAAASSPFTALTDVPNTYSGSAGQFLRVNSSGNGIEFTSASVSVVSGQPAPAGIAAGSTASIQFNSAGNISGSANLRWDDSLSQLIVTGDILYSGSLTNTSDVRKKESIESVGEGSEILRKILQLNAYRYNYKSDPKKEKHIGVLAQEVEKNFPEVVKTQKDADKTKSVDYQAMVPLLIEAIKQQQKMIEQQSSQIEELKGQLKRMSSEK